MHSKFVPYNLIVPSLDAAYAVPMVTVEASGLEVCYANSNLADGEQYLLCSCGASNFKTRGKPQTARHTAGE